MTVRDFGSERFDLRYVMAAEYEPIDVYDDPGISEIPASGDHTHQLFDDGIDLTPYLQTDWQMYNASKPLKMYRAGNHIVVDGQIKNSSVSVNDTIIFGVPINDPILLKYKAAFEVVTASGIAEDVLNTTFVPVTLKIFAGGSAVLISNIGDMPASIDRLTINAFAWRVDAGWTTEVPPDSRMTWRWDQTKWDGHVWSGAGESGWDYEVWDQSIWQ